MLVLVVPRFKQTTHFQALRTRQGILVNHTPREKGDDYRLTEAAIIASSRLDGEDPQASNDINPEAATTQERVWKLFVGERKVEDRDTGEWLSTSARLLGYSDRGIS